MKDSDYTSFLPSRPPLAFSTPERLVEDFVSRGFVVLAPENLGIPADVHDRLYEQQKKAFGGEKEGSLRRPPVRHQSESHDAQPGIRGRWQPAFRRCSRCSTPLGSSRHAISSSAKTGRSCRSYRMRPLVAGPKFSTGTRTTTAHGTGGNNAIIRPYRSRYCISHRGLTRTWGQSRSSPTPTTGQSITKRTRTTLSRRSSISIITSGAVRATLTLTSRTMQAPLADSLTCTIRMSRPWLSLSAALIPNMRGRILSIAAPPTTFGCATEPTTPAARTASRSAHHPEPITRASLGIPAPGRSPWTDYGYLNREPLSLQRIYLSNSWQRKAN